MNVQFSLSASSTTSVQNNKPEVVPVSSEQAAPANQVAGIHTTRDMNLKEKQGVNVSVAEEQLIRTIERAVKSLQGPQTTLEISIHEKTHDIMVKVLNKDTGELIREVPLRRH